MTNSNLNKFAYTLAEILITIGIIGVLAVIVLPVLISSSRKKVTEAKLKQTYSILSVALNAAESELGSPFYYGYANNGVTCPPNTFFCGDNVLYKDFIKPYVSGNVKEVNAGTCWGTGSLGCPSIKNPNGPTHFGKFVTFPNGVSIIIHSASISVVTDSLSFNSKKPLTITPGKNYFNFGPAVSSCSGEPCISTIPHVLKPFHSVDLPRYWLQAGKSRSKYTDEQMIENCKTASDPTTRAQFCTQIYLENDYKFPKNYPIKF